LNICILKTNMAELKIDDIKKAIKGILKGADLDNLSTKKVRKELEEKFATDLTKRKKEIDELVMQMITENEEEEEKDDQSLSSRKAKEEKNERTSAGSDDDGDDDIDKKEEENGAEESEDEEVVPKKKAKKSPPTKSEDKKKKKSASRADDSEDPVMSSIGDMNDEDLAKKLQEEESMGARGRTRGSRRPPPPPKKERKKKDPSEKRKNTGFSRPMVLSEKLAAVVGAEEMPRSDIVKALWAIVKERNLKDPKNGQYMKCDEQLADLFGRKTVRMFAMMKYLSKHIINPDDLQE